MDSAAYSAELAALGVLGPACETRVGSSYWLTYHMPDGSIKQLPPPDKMTPGQRSATILMLRVHIETCQTKRKLARKAGA